MHEQRGIDEFSGALAKRVDLALVPLHLIGGQAHISGAAAAVFIEDLAVRIHIDQPVDDVAVLVDDVDHIVACAGGVALLHQRILVALQDLEQLFVALLLVLLTDERLGVPAPLSVVVAERVHPRNARLFKDLGDRDDALFALAVPIDAHGRVARDRDYVGIG